MNGAVKGCCKTPDLALNRKLLLFIIDTYLMVKSIPSRCSKVTRQITRAPPPIGPRLRVIKLPNWKFIPF